MPYYMNLFPSNMINLCRQTYYEQIYNSMKSDFSQDIIVPCLVKFVFIN